MGRIGVPAGARWLSESGEDGSEEGFLKRVCSFAGGTKASDEFDALVHLVTRAITLSRKIVHIPGVDNTMDLRLQSGPVPFGQEDPRQAVMDQFQHIAEMGMMAGNGTSMAGTPFEGMCGAPCHWYGVFDNAERCRKHGNRVTSALGGCGDWAKHGSIRDAVS